MGEKRNQHVVPHEDGWAVRGEHAQRATETFEKKLTRSNEDGRSLKMKEPNC